jgi:hypothetical protein
MGRYAPQNLRTLISSTTEGRDQIRSSQAVIIDSGVNSMSEMLLLSLL